MAYETIRVEMTRRRKSNELGLSKDTVKFFGRRNGLAGIGTGGFVVAVSELLKMIF